MNIWLSKGGGAIIPAQPVGVHTRHRCYGDFEEVISFTHGFCIWKYRAENCENLEVYQALT